MSDGEMDSVYVATIGELGHVDWTRQERDGRRGRERKRKRFQPAVEV